MPHFKPNPMPHPEPTPASKASELSAAEMDANHGGRNAILAPHITEEDDPEFRRRLNTIGKSLSRLSDHRLFYNAAQLGLSEEQVNKTIEHIDTLKQLVNSDRNKIFPQDLDKDAADHLKSKATFLGSGPDASKDLRSATQKISNLPPGADLVKELQELEFTTAELKALQKSLKDSRDEKLKELGNKLEKKPTIDKEQFNAAVNHLGKMGDSVFLGAQGGLGLQAFQSILKGLATQNPALGLVLALLSFLIKLINRNRLLNEAERLAADAAAKNELNSKEKKLDPNLTLNTRVIDPLEQSLEKFANRLTEIVKTEAPGISEKDIEDWKNHRDSSSSTERRAASEKVNNYLVSEAKKPNSEVSKALNQFTDGAPQLLGPNPPNVTDQAEALSGKLPQGLFDLVQSRRQQTDQGLNNDSSSDSNPIPPK